MLTATIIVINIVVPAHRIVIPSMLLRSVIRLLITEVKEHIILF